MDVNELNVRRRLETKLSLYLTAVQQSDEEKPLGCGVNIPVFSYGLF